MISGGIMFIILGVILIILTVKGFSEETVTTYCIGGGFTVFGILLCVFTYLESEHALVYTLCFGLAAIFLWAGIFNISKKIMCNEKIEAIYLGMTAYTGGNGITKYTPNFQFNIDNKKYVNNSGEVFSKRYLDKKYKIGNTYHIYVQASNNHLFTTKKSVSLMDLNLIMLGIGCILIAIYLV